MFQVIGKYYKIISMNVNGTKYYFICKINEGGFIWYFKDLKGAIERFEILEKELERRNILNKKIEMMIKECKEEQNESKRIIK